MDGILFFVLFLLVGDEMKIARFDTVDDGQTVLEQVSKRLEVAVIGECTPIRMRTITRTP